MHKIPTLFVRDPDNMSRVLPEVNPACQWVVDGEGAATRKYDGTCVGFFAVVKGQVRVHGGGGIGSGEINEPGDLTGAWLARREVKPGKSAPEGFIVAQHDEITGKTVGWEPVEQSAFYKAFSMAVDQLGPDPYFGTYELCGPKVNGNPEGFGEHMLVRHSEASQFHGTPRTYEELAGFLAVLGAQGLEGIVWHHPDGRMAKLKVRDFPKAAA